MLELPHPFTRSLNTERDYALRLGWNPSVDAPKKSLACIDDIPFSPDTDVPCHAHPMGAAQILLFERHLIPNVSRSNSELKVTFAFLKNAFEGKTVNYYKYVTLLFTLEILTYRK